MLYTVCGYNRCVCVSGRAEQQFHRFPELLVRLATAGSPSGGAEPLNGARCGSPGSARAEPISEVPSPAKWIAFQRDRGSARGPCRQHCACADNRVTFISLIYQKGRPGRLLFVRYGK